MNTATLPRHVAPLAARNKNSANIPGYAGDRAPPARETLWTTKGADSPGSVDMARRLEVLDMMTVKEQLLFPTSIGLWGMTLINMPADTALLLQLGKGDPAAGYAYARKLMDAHNAWLVGAARV